MPTLNVNKLGKMKATLAFLLVITLVLISFNASANNETNESATENISLELNNSINETINITPAEVIDEKPIIKEEVLDEELPQYSLLGGTSEIGYEFLDNETLHLWNNLNDYYFDTNSGIQLTNHYDEYWTKNIFCLGYKTSSWNYLCNDQLNGFTWNIETDNTSYVEIIGYKDTTIQSYDIRIALRYYLEINDEDLTIQPFIKNLDENNINNDLRFVWRIEDIQIAGEEDNNVIVVGEQYTHNLSDNISVTYTNLTVGNYIINRNSEWLRLKWDSSLNDALQIKTETNQFNSPVTLAITTSGLNSGQNKTTTFYWIDATCLLNWKSTTPTDQAKLYDGNATHVVGGCLEPLHCPLSQNCIETVKVQSKVEGATGWTTLNSKDYEFALCETPEYTTNTYTFKHNNKTDIRIGYFVPTWAEEFGCAQPGNPYASEIRNDIWLNNHTSTAVNVTILPVNATADDNLNCTYVYQDLDNDAQNVTATQFNWIKDNVTQNITVQILNNSYTSNEEQWSCKVKTFDNIFVTGNEAFVNSSTINLLNGTDPELLGLQAINQGITNSIPNSTRTNYTWVYTRNLVNTQETGVYDVVASFNNQTWGFNYLTGNETANNMTNLLNKVILWQNTSLTYSEIVNQVETLINNTRE